MKCPFLFFRMVEALTRSVKGLIYTPSGSVPGDADRATLCPMGSRCPGLNAVIRMPSAVAKGKAPLLFVILHKYYCFVQCLNRVHPKKTRFNTISCVLMPFYGVYRTFSASLYSSGGFWSGSCLYSAYLSAICSRLCCGIPCCCPAGIGAVSAMP